MKNLFVLLIFYSGMVTGQSGMFYQGNMQVHNDVGFGFHTSLISNAPINRAEGLTGFYSENDFFISGTVIPDLFDVEIMTDGTAYILNGLKVKNNLNFISGNFNTPRDTESTLVQFSTDAFYTGETNRSKIDGFTEAKDVQDFFFPIGDYQQLRPLLLNSEGVNSTAKAVYYLDNPLTTEAFGGEYLSNRKLPKIGPISTTEFWHVESTLPSTITVNWNPRSELANLMDDISELILVGWNKVARRWLPLGNIAIGGDMSNGFITSDTFIPNDYSVITFAGVPIPLVVLGENGESHNYYLSANNDGVNDALVIPELAASPNNTVVIFDRNGVKVFEKKNYVDEFTGFANTGKFIVQQNKGLPTGFYFYFATLDDANVTIDGFVYLVR